MPRRDLMSDEEWGKLFDLIAKANGQLGALSDEAATEFLQEKIRDYNCRVEVDAFAEKIQAT